MIEMICRFDDDTPTHWSDKAVLVRCRRCKHYHPDTVKVDGLGDCERHNRITSEMDYCSKGVPKDDE